MIDTIKKEKIISFKNNLSSCVNSYEKIFKNKELILSSGQNKKQLAFIISGTAQIIKTDIDGNQTIIKVLKENDIFSYQFFNTFEDEFYIISTSTTAIKFIDYYNLIKNCTKECPYHNELVLYLFELLVRESRELNEKIELLSQKTVRDKIIFFIKKRMNSKNIFTVTTSYKAISEYLFVDRSNFMRELKKLEKEKIIKKEEKTIYYLE